MESTEQVEDDEAVVAPPRKSNPAAKPNRAFDEFRRILNEKAPVMSYGWSPAKVQSCKWLIVNGNPNFPSCGNRIFPTRFRHWFLRLARARLSASPSGGMSSLEC